MVSCFRAGRWEKDTIIFGAAKKLLGPSYLVTALESYTIWPLKTPLPLKCCSNVKSLKQLLGLIVQSSRKRLSVLANSKDILKKTCHKCLKLGRLVETLMLKYSKSNSHSKIISPHCVFLCLYLLLFRFSEFSMVFYRLQPPMLQRRRHKFLTGKTVPPPPRRCCHSCV